MGSLRSRFDAAKEVVNMELACFAGELMELSQKKDFSSPEAQKLVEDLLILCQQCSEMTSSELRAKCETVVQDLTEKRKLCQTGLLKWLLTRMLFILTRCTRLLHFERGSESIDENSLHKIKECLDSVPYVEMSWDPDPLLPNAGSAYTSNLIRDAKHELQGQIKTSNSSEATSTMDFIAINNDSFPQSSHFDLLRSVQEYHKADGNYLGDSVDKAGSSLHEQERNLGGSESVICRICEEVVPTSHLEAHSYICAYAEKCDLKCVDLDDRLLKLAEMLELIIDSFNMTFHASFDSPESSRIQIPNPGTLPEGYSPNVSEWRSKSMEGMFEDLHEMDTAFIEDSHHIINNLRGHLGMKLGQCGPPSSAGSITSGSSTNTPRAGNFDYLWMEHNNPSELEDVQQVSHHGLVHLTSTIGCLRLCLLKYIFSEVFILGDKNTWICCIVHIISHDCLGDQMTNQNVCVCVWGWVTIDMAMEAQMSIVIIIPILIAQTRKKLAILCKKHFLNSSMALNFFKLENVAYVTRTIRCLFLSIW